MISGAPRACRYAEHDMARRHVRATVARRLRQIRYSALLAPTPGHVTFNDDADIFRAMAPRYAAARRRYMSADRSMSVTRYARYGTLPRCRKIIDARAATRCLRAKDSAPCCATRLIALSTLHSDDTRGARRCATIRYVYSCPLTRTMPYICHASITCLPSPTILL